MSLAFCVVHAAPDLLERPAHMRTSERSIASVFLDVGRVGERLVAVGERGMILWSDDDGKSWQQAAVPVSVTLTGVAFIDQDNGWAIGHSGVLLQSDDQGLTWNKRLDGAQVADLAADEAKAPGADPQLMVNAERLIADGPDKPFLSIHFSDEGHGVVAGAYGLFIETRDAGQSWQSCQRSIDNPYGLHFYSIADLNGDIWISGEQGSLFLSSDKGHSYREVATPYVGTYFGIVGVGSRLVAYGMRGNAYWTDDKGETWQKSHIPGDNTLTAGLVTRNGEIVLVDDGGSVYISIDDGRRFVRASMPKMGPLTDIVELADGAFLFAGARGLSRARIAMPTTESKS